MRSSVSSLRKQGPIPRDLRNGHADCTASLPHTRAGGYGSLLSQGRQMLPRNMRRHREPLPVLPDPAVRVTAIGLFPLGIEVAGLAVDDREIAEDADLD